MAQIQFTPDPQAEARRQVLELSPSSNSKAPIAFTPSKPIDFKPTDKPAAATPKIDFKPSETPSVKTPPAKKTSLFEKAINVVPNVGKTLIKAGSEGIDASIKGGANLVSGIAAPFMSQQSLDKLQREGLYTPPSGNVALQAMHDYSGATYGALFSPLVPVYEAAVKQLSKAGVPERGIDLLGTGMDVLGVAGVPRGSTKAPVKTADLIAGTADKAMQPMRKIFSPAAVSKEAERVAAVKREQLGLAERDTAASGANLEKHVTRFDNLTPQEQADFPKYMESYKNPTQQATLNLAPELKAAADDLRASYKYRAQKIQQTKSMKNMPLVEDYLARNFKGTPQQQAKFNNLLLGKQGKGGFTKARKYPTYDQALQAARAAGMEPVEPNFIKAANLYNANTDMFIAHNRAFDALKKEGMIKYGRPGRAPDGWVPLEGRMGFKVGVDKKSNTPIQLQAYAPADAARVYNNFLSRGLTDTAGDMMKTTQRAFNFVTAMKLGLSNVWHAGITGTAAMSSDLARGTRYMLKGQPLKGATTIAKSPFAPYRVAREGAKFHKQYLKMTNYGPNVEKLVDLATRANALQSKRPAYMDISSRSRHFKDLFKKAPGLDGLTGAMQSLSAPMFDKWIPAMKRGVIIERLQQWVEEHPTATFEEQKAYARTLGDSVDNRFGEMIRDNLFWNRTLRDAMQFGLLSYSWVAGATRMASGATREAYQTLRHGKELGPNAEYLLANAMTAVILNSAYQYLHTKEGPQEMRDLFFPRTGGKQYVGRPTVPERAVLPSGHWTQYAHYLHDPLAELYNEGNPGAKILYEALTNRDYRGLPIAKPLDTWSENYLKEVPDAVWRYFKHIGGEAVTPIAVSSYFQRNKVTGISPAETVGLAARPAPAFVAAPEQTERMEKKQDQALWKRKIKSDNRLKGRRESSAPAAKPKINFQPAKPRIDFRPAQ